MLMNFPALRAKYEMDIHGVLHVGAHLAEEADFYTGCGPVWWVEANPAVIPTIERKLVRHRGQQVIQALVYEDDDVYLDFNVTNYDGMSSSILEFGTHPTFSPDTFYVDRLLLQTRTIDSLAKEYGIQANFLNMDIQGAELHALRGAFSFLEGVDYVMTEVNKDEVYVGCAKVHELDEFLGGFAFERVETSWVDGQGWGDGLYVRWPEEA